MVLVYFGRFTGSVTLRSKLCTSLVHSRYWVSVCTVRGRLTLPMPSIRVAGFTSGQVFCELKIILWNCYKRVLFSSTVGRIYVKL